MNEQSKELEKHKGTKLTFEDLKKLNFGDFIIMKDVESEELMLGRKITDESHEWAIEGNDYNIILTWTKTLLKNSPNWEVYTYAENKDSEDDILLSSTKLVKVDCGNDDIAITLPSPSLFQKAYENTFSFDATINLSKDDIGKILEKDNKTKIPSPKEIKNYLDEYIIGQEDAKKTLSVAVHNHLIRINNKFDDIEIQKSNILMMGESGSGKTLLAQTIAKYLDVPFVIVNSPDYTPAGYVGKNVEDILDDLIQNANGDIKKAEKGIVFLDEFDKIFNGGGKSNVRVKDGFSGNILASFLKLIEGTEVEVGGGSIWSSKKKINTSQILFITGGAFQGIEEQFKKDDEDHKVVGFNSEQIIKNKEVITGKYWDKITTEHLREYGLSNEILGRLPIVVKLKPLAEEDLIHILTIPKNAIIRQYQQILKVDNVDITFSKEALQLIAKMAIKNKTGARGLRTIVENIVSNIIYEIPNDGIARKCTITPKIIEENLVPKFRKIN